jgi:hypothetical protein
MRIRAAGPPPEGVRETVLCRGLGRWAVGGAARRVAAGRVAGAWAQLDAMGRAPRLAQGPIRRLTGERAGRRAKGACGTGIANLLSLMGHAAKIIWDTTTSFGVAKVNAPVDFTCINRVTEV